MSAPRTPAEALAVLGLAADAPRTVHLVRDALSDCG